MTKEEFVRRWNKDDEGDGLTYEDIADCAKEWGLFSRPEINDINIVRERVLNHAGCE